LYGNNIYITRQTSCFFFVLEQTGDKKHPCSSGDKEHLSSGWDKEHPIINTTPRTEGLSTASLNCHRVARIESRSIRAINERTNAFLGPIKIKAYQLKFYIIYLHHYSKKIMVRNEITKNPIGSNIRNKVNLN